MLAGKYLSLNQSLTLVAHIQKILIKRIGRLEFDSSYEDANLQPMKQFMFIFLLISLLFSKNEDSDVNHMIVDYNGHTISCIIDSMGYEYIFFTVKDSIELDSMKIKDTYYIYTDLNKIFHYSWSFEENIRRMENRTGSLFTTYGDTINFMDIKFYSDMINPEIYIKKYRKFFIYTHVGRRKN